MAQGLFFSLELSSLSACSTYSICSSTPHFLSKNSTFNHLTLSFKPLKPQKLLHFHLKPISSHNNRWSLRGSTALVTGGTRGIGRAIVEELVGFGAKVHTCSRNETELNECLENWVGSGFEVTGSVCDVSVRARREQLIAALSSLFDNKLDILIHNRLHPHTVEALICTQNWIWAQRRGLVSEDEILRGEVMDEDDDE